MFLAGGRQAVPSVCRAQRGRWRPQADDTGFGFLFLTFGFVLLD